MKTATARTSNPDEIVQELLHGGGAVKIAGLLSAEKIAAAGAKAMAHSGQEPHVDHPYCDFHAPATGDMPGSEKKLRHPTPENQLYDYCARLTAKPVDVALFDDVTPQCAMPNKSDHDRSGILIQYLPKWVKPTEDIPAALPQSFIEDTSPDVRQLIGQTFPYPEVLDTANAGITAGRN